ncbi:LytR/AlgR family response regulator transcription factor [Flavobacterium proteolyticum]|uniref:Response regulator transcription factor n=1 Tax=Flavobacterium proteolyticum TaxID=2911683 RepID=A0ABR9WV14_9FLAO|nr:LytTR family DNA-binding domain-containing protein [Flavobacterium proteolyticum]MBE9577511.1 response regulator transcription factor [Flavobacterium proteolyticum]
MKKYTAFIVDDEDRNVNIIVHFLNKFCPNIQIIGSSNSFEEAIGKINLLKPEILYLDIQLHNKTAFELLDVIDISEVEIVLVTAYENYAVKAFKYNVLDYVMKPISIEDIVLASNKAISRIEEKEIFDNSKVLEMQINNLEYSSFITISSIDKIDIIKKNEILFCKSDGRYTTFYLKNEEEYVACKNIGEYENILTDNCFFRIHQSYIINLDFVVSVNKKSGYYCEMINGARLPIAKRRQEALNKILKV